jgi:hypothetical protein
MQDTDGEHRRRRVRGARPGRASRDGAPADASPATPTDPTPYTEPVSTDVVSTDVDVAASSRAEGTALSVPSGHRPAPRPPTRMPNADRMRARPPADRDRTPGRDRATDESDTPGRADVDRVTSTEREPYDSHAPGAIDDHERGLRGLVGGGSSQVSVAAAMRARDASRPSDADLAEAQQSLVIVHRGWVPRDG